MEAKTEAKTKFKQYVFSFQEGDGKNKMLLGGKGANLCEMTQIGLNVPPGFCHHHRGLPGLPRCPNRLPAGLMDDQVQPHDRRWKRRPARASATAKNPLLVSVRSGSAMSMPGMMDTILNLGLNSKPWPA